MKWEKYPAMDIVMNLLFPVLNDDICYEMRRNQDADNYYPIIKLCAGAEYRHISKLIQHLVKSLREGT